MKKARRVCVCVCIEMSDEKIRSVFRLFPLEFQLNVWMEWELRWKTRWKQKNNHESRSDVVSNSIIWYGLFKQSTFSFPLSLPAFHPVSTHTHTHNLLNICYSSNESFQTLQLFNDPLLVFKVLHWTSAQTVQTFTFSWTTCDRRF